VFLVFTGAAVQAQSTTDAGAIKQTALDYIEGWYEGNTERMERALHPELAKRIVRTNAEGASRLDQMSAMTLVQGTRRGGGKNTLKEKQQKDVTILDVFENAASVKVAERDATMRAMIEEADRNLLVVIQEMREGARLADEANDAGTNDLFARTVQIHEKHEWWLRDILKKHDGLTS